MAQVLVSGAFDNPSAHDLRLLQEASGRGGVQLGLWSDAAILHATGAEPKFSFAERLYFFSSMRYVDRVTEVGDPTDPAALAAAAGPVTAWLTHEAGTDEAVRSTCEAHGIAYEVLTEDSLAGYPEREADPLDPAKKKVVVTGCYDWFHSGHVRFFEETSELGDLYVVVGHDANIELLKGEGHPMIKEDERRYMAQSVRFVNQAFVSSGNGWMDAEPEIERLKPDVYAVNEDGDVPEKRAFCEKHSLEYVVLKRTPKEGLKRRSSTDLRGF